MSIKNPQLPAVNAKYGAPMGRPEFTDNLTDPCRCFRLRFIDGDYDDGGAYWGAPANLYCCLNEGTRLFTRADNRKKAKEKFKSSYPQIKFVN